MEYKFQNNRKKATHYYKDGNSWVKFCINYEDKMKWTLFCESLGRIATKEDFELFINQTNISYVTL